MTGLRAGAGRQVTALLVVGALVVAACGGGRTVTGILATVGSPRIVASGFAFEPSTIDVVAGTSFSLELVNEDNAPHNISIYRDASAGEKLFGGEVLGGPESRVYAVPALPAGTWWFRCDIHPDMHGTIVAS